MNCASIEDILFKEVEDSTLSIFGFWQRREEFGEEPSMYTEVDIMEFNADGTGIWKHFDNTGFLESIEDEFTYRVQESRIIFRYASCPEQCDIRDYRLANGHLILIDDYGMPYETMEVYGR